MSKNKKPIKHPQPRSKEPFFSNYDLYENDSGPGAGLYSNMNKYKSVKDFINKNKKKKKKSKISSRRIKLLSLALDFSLEQQVTPIVGDSGLDGFMGGMGDIYFNTNDFEGKSPDDLDYNRPENFDEYINKLDDDKFVGILSHLINNHNDFQGFPGEDLDSPDTSSNNYYDRINESFPGHSVVF